MIQVSFGVTVPEQIAALIREGRKTEAVRLLRDTAGVGLEAAQEAVERLEADPAFDPFPPEGRRPEVDLKPPVGALVAILVAISLLVFGAALAILLLSSQ